ncbi:MAG: Crp/Fnr family transcriptional regulator [Candidatus Acidiferrales bacterium]
MISSSDSTGGQLSVVNEVGREAVVAILAAGDFFGEGCLEGQNARMGTATAITPTTLLVIEKREMARVLHAEHAFSDRFVSHMIARNIRIEEGGSEEGQTPGANKIGVSESRP